ncbi:MAG TPA: monovalent cation/H+ antiporter complex subunit F [Tepidisphaeraceae bacterium]|nr:monovalent cation/H+ antiporter complex subunit F [Tepidisphaeraceae bacterium]
MTGVLVAYTIHLGLVVIFAGMALCLARLLRGPHLADRALAADALITHLMGLVLLLTIRMETLLLFDGVLVLALLGFVTTVAAAQYIMRPHLRRLREQEREIAERGEEVRP